MRVTVVVSVSVCLLPRASCYMYIYTYMYLIYMLKTGVVKLLAVFSSHALCGFHWERFVQTLWWHLPIISAFLVSWQTSDGRNRQRWVLWSKLVCKSRDRSYNSTDSSLNIPNCQVTWVSFLTSSCTNFAVWKLNPLKSIWYKSLLHR